MPKEKGHKIVWTMMETYKIHHQMIAMVNQSYDELWTPTEWNRQVFIGSGARVPSRVVPLGVNKSIYRPMKGNKLPPCRRVTTDKAGEIGNPSGFIFLTLGLPSFRKGFDVLVEAFDKVFADRDDVHLVLAVTHSLPEWNKQVYKQFAGRKTSIWTLEGQYNEHEMAKIYCASNAYVSASRGEGWNLPAQEAGACGIPVIVPENTSHAEVVGKAGWSFPIEGFAPSAEAKKVSMWYEGMPFAVFGKKSIAGLAEAMETVLAGGAEVERRRDEFLLDVRMRFSWDLAAMRVIDRLLEVQP
jgi:hypothetical protein